MTTKGQDPEEDLGLPARPEPMDFETNGRARSERILIIQHDPDLARFIEAVFHGGGFLDVTFAEDGESGLERIGREHFDLVITDFVLPRSMGDEVVRRVRADLRSRDLPVFMLTTRAGSEDIRTVMQAGAADYITIPFDPPELLARARATLRRRAS